MASLTAPAISIPSFCGLKALTGRTTPISTVRTNDQPPRMVVPAVCRASLESVLPKVGTALLATSTAVLLAASANAAVVKMGDDDGSLKFVPDSVSIAAGETIVFRNNAGFPHNIIFDEDEVPSGVKAEAISHDEYMNSPGEEFSLTLTEKGTYKFYCEPHQGGGMKGEITVT